jgi:ankyrin repeat protein
MRIQPTILLLGLLVFAATGCASLDDVLRLAVVKGERTRVQTLIEKGADVKAATTEGVTPLHRAAEKGHREVVALLLEKGAAVNVATTDNGVTPLIIAAYHGHREIAEFLLRHGADKTAKERTGQRQVDVARARPYSAGSLAGAVTCRKGMALA